MKPVGKPDAANPHVRFDERGRETEQRYRARPRLYQLEAGHLDGLACKRIGAPLLFCRLWDETGCRAVIEALLAERSFEFSVERAVFASVLHRITAASSSPSQAIAR